MARTWPFPLSIIFLFFAFRITISSDMDQLLSFKSTFSDPNGSLRGWDATSNTSPCEWLGVDCTDNKIYKLTLENMGLSGQLKLDSLTELPLLRSISFNGNNFSGPFPDLNKLESLKFAYFSKNNLSGEIPDDAFEGMLSLLKVDVSRNGFLGPIPGSLVDVPKLLELKMDYNTFVGEIPDFLLGNISVFNVSNNNLVGKIPDAFAKLDPTMFAGNKDLCGAPLPIKCKLVLTPPTPYPPPETKSSGLRVSILIAILVTSTGFVLVIIGGTCAFTRSRKQNTGQKGGSLFALEQDKKYLTSEMSSVEQVKKYAVAAVNYNTDPDRLIFVSGNREEMFELHDLLRAPAEILGSGEFGSSYKASLVNGPVVVAKRFKEMNGVGKEDFEKHMKRLGGLSHPNLLPLVAYLFKKEEKILVTDFIPYGSLASVLHGNRNPNTQNLDWPARLKIVKGTARCLYYLYKELSMTTITPHGHLKSSNVLLDSNLQPLLSDYGLAPPVTNQSHAAKTMIAYKSPEYKQQGRLSKKSDVWSLGVLILEILTGKYPEQVGPGLADWVNSVVREEWTGEVFDGDMRRSRNGEGDMLRLLQIGLGCCEVDVSKRWELKYALEQIEELREGGDGDEDYSYLSEGDTYSKAMTDDEFSFSTVK